MIFQPRSQAYGILYGVGVVGVADYPCRARMYGLPILTCSIQHSSECYDSSLLLPNDLRKAILINLRLDFLLWR